MKVIKVGTSSQSRIAQVRHSLPMDILHDAYPPAKAYAGR